MLKVDERKYKNSDQYQANLDFIHQIYVNISKMLAITWKTNI